MHVEHGSIDNARELFDKMPKKDGPWSEMIAARVVATVFAWMSIPTMEGRKEGRKTIIGHTS